MKRLLFTFCLLTLSVSLPAQDSGSGLDFLNIGPSARLLSISEASTASVIGPAAMYTNPSLLALEEQSGIDINYTLWVAGVNNQFAAVNFLKNRSAFAVGVYNSGSGGFEARDRPGPSAGDFSVGYLSLAGAAAHRAGPFSIGITAQYLREEVFHFRASGYAINAGISASFLEKRVRAGATLKNLGNMESLDEQSTDLPASFNLGLSIQAIQFTTPGNNDLPVLVTVLTDWRHPLNDTVSEDYVDSDNMNDFFSFGVSINMADLVIVEGGYRFGPSERPYSIGTGLLIDNIRINYALVPFSTGFGSAHSFGVQYYF